MGDVQSAAGLSTALRVVPGVRAVVGWARLRSGDGDPQRGPRAAAACAFWGQGRTGVVSAGSEHGVCSVGRVTQGFASAPPADDPGIALMVDSGYFDPAEFSHLPVLPGGHTGIVYGPVEQLPVAPEALLVFAEPLAVMVLGEALQTLRLDGPGLRFMGRPTCAAVAAAVNDGEMVGSLGCAGARMHAGMAPGEALVVVPAEQFGDLAQALPATMERNRAVTDMHRAISAS